MRKARKAVVASLLKAADAKGAVPFVITSAVLDETEIKKTELTNYGCNHCGTVIASNKGIAPFCQTCGSDEVDEWDNALNPEEVVEDELANVTCAKCGTHNVMSLQTAATFKGVVHCSACGTQVAYDVPEYDDGDDIYLLDGEDDDEVVDMTEQEEIPEAAPADTVAPVAKTPVADRVAEDNPETSEAEPTADDTSMDPIDNLEEVPDSGIEEDIEEVQDDTADGDEETSETEAPAEGEEGTDDVDDDDDDSDEDDEDEDDDYDYDEEAKVATATLLSVVDGDIALAYMGDTLIATRGGLPVAKLEKASAADYQGVFHSRNFAQAIRHQIAQLGPKKALASFGFDLARVKVPIKGVALAHIEKSTAKKAQEIAAAQESYESDLTQCLGLASVAMTKGINKKRQNVLKAALVRELASLGVRESAAANMVNRVFAHHGETYHRDLFAYAKELMGKSVDFRNELADLVEETDPNAVAPQFDEDSDPVDDVADAPVEARLTQTAGVVPTSRQRRERQVASVGGSSVAQLANAVRSQNGGRLF